MKEVKANVDGLRRCCDYGTSSQLWSRCGRTIRATSKREELAKQYDIKTAYQPFGAQEMPIDAEIQTMGMRMSKDKQRPRN